MERIYALPTQAKHFHRYDTDAGIKAHNAYTAAKSGNPDAAVELVVGLALPFLQKIKDEIPNECIFVSPFAREATGDNAIPLLLSMACAQVFNGINETDIVQLQRVFHTGADPMERLIARPSFEGAVKANADYILVDDVTSMGGTLAELANYIQLNSGKVFGTITLVNAGRSKAFEPNPKHIKILKERFGDEIKQIFGIQPQALTANEANYLVGFKTVDEIRNRRLKAEKETHLRLLSKGVV